MSGSRVVDDGFTGTVLAGVVMGNVVGCGSSGLIVSGTFVSADMSSVGSDELLLFLIADSSFFAKVRSSCGSEIVV